MYDNIGKKIKILSMVLCLVEIFVFFILGTIIEGVASLLVMVIGALVSWVSSFFIYGFGELIEKVSNIEQHMRNNKPQRSQKSSPDQINELNSLYAQDLITKEEYQHKLLKIRDEENR